MADMTLYHVSDKRNRGAIRRYGLLARATKDHNYPDCHGQPTGVFCVEPDRYLWSGSGKENWRDIWEIDATDLPLTNDRIIQARVITCTVPPERLKVITTLRQYELYRWTPEEILDALANGEAVQCE